MNKDLVWVGRTGTHLQRLPGQLLGNRHYYSEFRKSLGTGRIDGYAEVVFVQRKVCSKVDKVVEIS